MLPQTTETITVFIKLQKEQYEYRKSFKRVLPLVQPPFKTIPFEYSTIRKIAAPGEGYYSKIYGNTYPDFQARPVRENKRKVSKSRFDY